MFLLLHTLRYGWVAYYLDDLLADNLFDNACGFGTGITGLARDEHHLFDKIVSQELAPLPQREIWCFCHCEVATK